MEHKIVFTGPVGAGKTTAIAAISDIPVVRTESMASDHVAERKATTTVAMDYGVLNLTGGEKVHLYGTPGQQRFSFMWDIVAVGALGVVVLIDNAAEDPLADLELYLDAFAPLVKQRAVVVGVSRMDVKPRPGLYSFHTRLADLGVKAPVFEIDARDPDDIRTLLQGLLALLDPGVKR